MSEPVIGRAGSAERLQKVLARAGYGSRRSCEGLVLQGRVTVNGRTVRTLGSRVSTADLVAVDGRAVKVQPERAYILLNKPGGYVTTTSDPQGRPTVLDLVPAPTRVFPVGRLDVDSEGLLLLTNDGELAYRMTHPRFELEKEYHVLVAGHPDQASLNRLREGIDLDGRPTSPAVLTIQALRPEGTWLRFVIHEGRKRQIRRMCETVGLSVRRLVRVRVGPLELGCLKPMEHRVLSEQEVIKLSRQIGIQIAQPLVIAIDGPAGSGKSSLAEALAERHGLLYLDTGAMYRAMALLVLRRGIDLVDEDVVSRLAEESTIEITPRVTGDPPYNVVVDGEDVTKDLFTPEVGRAVSVVSAYPRLRRALVERQREIAARGRAVVVGRDIGTVVLPGAPIKLFLDASPEVRARRRQDQLQSRGIEVPLEQVLDEIRLRDKLDSERATSPLTITPDAVVINSDYQTVEEEMSLVDELLRKYEADQELA